MESKRKDYKRYLFFGIIIIALGVTFSTTLTDRLGSLGTVFIALGSLFFILSMARKQQSDKQNNEP